MEAMEVGKLPRLATSSYKLTTFVKLLSGCKVKHLVANIDALDIKLMPKQIWVLLFDPSFPNGVIVG